MPAKLVATAILLLSIGARLAAQAYFESDPIGLELARIDPERAASTEWVLAVHFEGTTEIRVLTHSGAEVQRWEDEYDHGQLVAERVFDNGVLSSSSRFQEGRVVEENGYSGGTLETRSIYRYSGAALKGIDVYAEDGKLLYQNRYERGSDGRLRRAVRVFPDGSYFESLYSYSDGRLRSEWHGTEASGDRYLYSNGELVATENWKDDKIRSHADFSASGSERIAKETDLVTGRVVTRTYDADGKELREDVTVNGRTVESVEFSYTDERLVAKIDRTPGVREESRYSYDKKGELSKVEITRNRVLVKATYYTGDNEYYDELYANGVPFLRVYYTNGTKTKEEVIGG